MNLTEIHIDQFKRIRSSQLILSNLNILVGANGSGKSSIIQAIHLASCLMRQAAEVRQNRTSPVSINELDYLPTDTYWELGHGTRWGNQAGTPSSKVAFLFEDDDGNQVHAFSEFRSARNAGISVTGNIPSSVYNLYRGKGIFFSAYIPGISGIPNQEPKQSKRVVLKACSFGDANVYLRNALYLLSHKEIQQVQDWLSELIGQTRIDVQHNDARDLVIRARVCISGREYPLELLGMGYLQLIQIFCYILLFKPQILLVDEPDIHLHPSVQEKLSTTLSRIASERQIKVLLTTHSPFIVRGAPLNTNVFWIENGEIQASTRESVELALGWGAFGKKIIIISEDAKTTLLEKVVSQWPEIEKFVTFYRGRGYRNLLKLNQAQELYEALGRKFQIVVHRDRDSLTDDEVISLKEGYVSQGISLWLTDLSDIEAYFCQKEFLSQFLDCSEEDAEVLINHVIDRDSVPIKEQFEAQRRAHNEELHKGGGSPLNDTVWNEFQRRPLRGSKGKYIFKQLKDQIPSNRFSEANISNHQLDSNLALSLKIHLEACLEN
jgi:ABC-type cobalamin/Fe3+-siderophores transport system ATPase subunit